MANAVPNLLVAFCVSGKNLNFPVFMKCDTASQIKWIISAFFTFILVCVCLISPD